MRRWKTRAAAVVTAVMASSMALSGCTGSDSESAGGSPSSDEKPIKLVFVSNQPASGAVSSVFLNGFKDALKTYNATGDFRAPQSAQFNAADEVKLIKSAIAAKPDGIIVIDPDPKGLNDAIQEASDAGIPVILTSAGENEAEATGALTFVGTNEKENGRVAGEKMAALGVEHPVLFTVAPGIQLVDDRNAGFESAFPEGSVDVVPVPAADLNNAAKMTQILDAAMIKNKDADAIFSIGGLLSPSMLSVRKSLGSRADSMQFAAIDLGEQVVDALEANEMAFAIDQQAYFTGYDPVKILAFYIRYGFTPPLDNTYIGPTVVTPDNMSKYQDAVERGMR